MKQYIKESVNRFLGWKLPVDFAPDAGISFKREENSHMPVNFRFNHEPTGTNLFTADQAEAMLTHVCKPLTDRVAELDAESNHLRAVAKAAISFLKDGEVKMVDRITELEVQLAGTQKDAARYQWLRRGQRWSVIDGIGNDLRAEMLDAAVDAAMQPKEQA